MIICHWAILHYNMSFKTIAGRSDGVFWWFPALSEDQKNKLSNSPKLSCGFNPIETIVAFMRRAIALPFGTMGACLQRKQRLYSDSRNFFVLRSLVLRVVSFEKVYSALSDDVWYCSGWYWKFLRNIDLKSRHANVFGAHGSLRQLCNVCVYGGGSLRQLCNVCVYGAKIFPVCLAFQRRKISSILSSCSFWRKNHTNQREVWFSKNILAVETFPPNCMHMCIFWGWKDRYTLHVNGSKQCGPGGLWLCEDVGLDRVNQNKQAISFICMQESICIPLHSWVNFFLSF